MEGYCKNKLEQDVWKENNGYTSDETLYTEGQVLMSFRWYAEEEEEE